MMTSAGMELCARKVIIGTPEENFSASEGHYTEVITGKRSRAPWPPS